MLNISGVVFDSIVDGPGMRVTVFTQGCSHNCKGCHNPQTHSFKEDICFDEEKQQRFFEDVKKDPLITGLTISGGDPFDNDLEELRKFLSKYRLEFFPKHDIWLYTGYTIEQLFSMAEYNKNIESILRHVDVIVDGEYIEELKDLSLPFRGSQNQRIIKLKGNFISSIDDVDNLVSNDTVIKDNFKYLENIFIEHKDILERLADK